MDNLVYDPTKSLVRLIDPLSPRFVYLNAIPSSVATDLDPETGKLVPYSNSAGTIQLPSTVVDRISYDPLNRKLIFEGTLDESGAGDPLLLINVLTNARRAPTTDRRSPRRPPAHRCRLGRSTSAARAGHRPAAAAWTCPRSAGG